MISPPRPSHVSTAKHPSIKYIQLRTMVNVYARTILSQSHPQLLFNAFLAQITFAEHVHSKVLNNNVINAFKMHSTMLELANAKISFINRDLNVSLVLLDALLVHLQDAPPVKQVQTQVVLLQEIK